MLHVESGSPFVLLCCWSSGMPMIPKTCLLGEDPAFLMRKSCSQCAVTLTWFCALLITSSCLLLPPPRLLVCNYLIFWGTPSHFFPEQESSVVLVKTRAKNVNPCHSDRRGKCSAGREGPENHKVTATMFHQNLWPFIRECRCCAGLSSTESIVPKNRISRPRSQQLPGL